MRIAIDARWMVGEFRGMGHYAAALVASCDRDVTRVVPARHPSDRGTTVSRGWGFFPYWEQVALPRICQAEGITHLICPYNTAPVWLPARVRLISVVHDLIYLEPWARLPPSRSIYQTLGRIYRRWNVPYTVRRADHLVTVSNYSRAEICRRFDIPPQKVHVIPNSLADDWFVTAPLPQSERAPYMLTVAGEAPHKNLATLIRAFAQLPNDILPAHALTLRIVGVKSSQRSTFLNLAAKLAVAERIVFEPFLTEPALRALYRRARLFVLPSLYEGFGIPLLEAMASGTPVACSDACSLPEVLAQSGWLFNPRDVDHMSGVMGEALASEKALEHAAVSGLQRAQHYRRDAVSVQMRQFWSTI